MHEFRNHNRNKPHTIMDNNIVSTAYAPLQPPYQVIKYGKDVAMQIGTLIVTVQKGKKGYQIETHSHPVVAYEDKNGKGLCEQQLTYHEFLEGAVWNNVEVKHVTTVCLTGATLTWKDFLTVLDHECLLGMNRGIPDVDLYWSLRKLGVKVLPPEVRECEVRLFMMPQPEETGLSLQSWADAELFLNVSIAEDDFKTGKENVFYKKEEEEWDSHEWKDDEKIWDELDKQLSVYRYVLRDLLFDDDVNHFTVTYKTEVERFKKIVERLNSTDDFVNLAYIS